MPIQSSRRKIGALRVLMLSTCAVFAANSAMAQSAGEQQAQVDKETIEEIVVRGISLSLKKAVEDKRNSEGIQDGVSADDLGRLPNKNSAEAINKLPGVNITQDQGEGRYVSIRGASPNLNAITVDGQAVGSVETNSRRVPLDVIGGELLGGIDVIKAVTPDMEANAVGGLINVKTPSPFDEKNAFFGRLTGQIGDQELDSFTPYAVTASAGGRFGSDESIGVIGGVSYNKRHYLTKGLYADDWASSPGSLRGIPQSHKFNDYELDRKRTGFNGSVEFKPNDDSHYYIRGLVTKTDETEYRYRGRNYFARVASNLTFTSDGVGTYRNMRLRAELRDQSTERRIANFTAGGENTFDNLKIDYSAGVIRNKIDQPTRSWTFQSPDIFSGSFDMNPAFFTVSPDVNLIASNVSRIGINSYSETLAIAHDKGEQFKLNAKYDFDGADTEGYFKIGALYRNARKSQDLTSVNYTAGTGGAAAFNIGSPGVWAGEFLEGHVKSAFYQVGPKIDRVGLETFTEANKSNTTVLRQDANASLSASTTGDFKTQEKILAAYAMGSITLGEWTLLGGGRVEQTKVSGEAFDLVNGTTVKEVKRPGKYTDFMPGVHVKFKPDTGPFMFRAAWTNTIGRPEYSDITANRVVSNVIFSPGVFDGTISQGNPDLKAYKSHNYDVSLEYYLADGGIASIAGFYKDVRGFIYREVITQNNVTFEGTQYNSLVTTTPRNADKGNIKGAEFNYQQRMTFLPGPLSGLGVGVSMTVVGSGITVRTRTDKLPFVGQADKVYSLIGFYNYGPVELVATYAWADNILVAVGGTANDDIYDENYGRLDLKASYRITDNLSMFMEAQNLNQEPLGEFQNRPSYTTRKEIYGRTGYVGMTYKW